MEKGARTVYYDKDLHIEAYRLNGILQPFPNHFHEYYVIGAILQGKRLLSCKNHEYTVGKEDIIIFNPKENHKCIQKSDETLYYCALNIKPEVMAELAGEITGKKYLPNFTETVIHDRELYCYLVDLHEQIMAGSKEFEKDELLFFMLSILIEKFSKPFSSSLPDCPEEIKKACGFINDNYKRHLSLEQICRYVGLSKSALLRSFTKAKGVTPYRYLETIRLTESKKLLENGVRPVDAAMEVGFSDQSHFTNFFTMFTSLTPGAYSNIFKKND